MPSEKVIWCSECGFKFDTESQLRQHEERNCVPWVKGDRVTFPYGLIAQNPATVTHLGPLVGPGESRLVYVETDEVVNDKEVDELHDGKHYFVPLTHLSPLQEERTIPA